jgi:hypothetical protein
MAERAAWASYVVTSIILDLPDLPVATATGSLSAATKMALNLTCLATLMAALPGPKVSER